MQDTVCDVLADQQVIHSYLETTTTHKQCLHYIHGLNEILSTNKCVYLRQSFRFGG